MIVFNFENNVFKKQFDGSHGTFVSLPLIYPIFICEDPGPLLLVYFPPGCEVVVLHVAQIPGHA